MGTGIYFKFRKTRDRKPFHKFIKKNWRYSSKKCAKCGKRKPNKHHYLCNRCWLIKHSAKSSPFNAPSPLQSEEKWT